MALEIIRKAVLDAAQSEADRVLAKAKAVVEKDREQRTEAVKEEFERQFHAAARAIDEEYSRGLIQAKGGHGKQLLEHRNACLQEAFKQAQEHILSWDAVRYADIMRSQLSRVAADAGGRARIHPSDKDVFSKLLADINQLRAIDKHIVLDDSVSLPERGGFVFVSAAYEVDRTIRTVLMDIERELAPEIAAELF